MESTTIVQDAFSKLANWTWIIGKNAQTLNFLTACAKSCKNSEKREKRKKRHLPILLRKRKPGKQRGGAENSMIKKYLENYFDKIKDTKKVARDKNVGVWW